MVNKKQTCVCCRKRSRNCVKGMGEKDLRCSACMDCEGLLHEIPMPAPPAPVPEEKPPSINTPHALMDCKRCGSKYCLGCKPGLQERVYAWFHRVSK